MPTQTEIVEQVKLAAEAFLYGYPLVYSLHEIAKFPAVRTSLASSRFLITLSGIRAICLIP